MKEDSLPLDWIFFIYVKIICYFFYFTSEFFLKLSFFCSYIENMWKPPEYIYLH